MQWQWHWPESGRIIIGKLPDLYIATYPRIQHKFRRVQGVQEHQPPGQVPGGLISIAKHWFNPSIQQQYRLARTFIPIAEANSAITYDEVILKVLV